MEVLREGHRYQLASLEGKNPQVIQFIEKMPAKVDSAKLVTTCDGTTNEEVLEMLIDRLKHLNRKAPCPENIRAILNLKKALVALQSRTKDRQQRGIEGTTIP